MLKRLLFILLLSITLRVLTSCSELKFKHIQKSDDIDLKYKAALEYYEKKDYTKANILFEEILPNLKGQEGAEIGSYYQAYTFYNSKQYVMSAFYFREFYETYPRSRYTEEAMFMHAKSLFKDSPDYNLDQTSTYDALKAIQSFANNYSRSQYMEETNKMSDELTKKLEKKAFENAKTYYKIGNYSPIMFKAAVVAFTTFQLSFPDSEYNEHAAFLKVEAQYKLAHASYEAVIKKGEKVYLKKERFYETIEYYNTFIDKYPNSKHKKSAENMYENSMKELDKLKN